MVHKETLSVNPPSHLLKPTESSEEEEVKLVISASDSEKACNSNPWNKPQSALQVMGSSWPPHDKHCYVHSDQDDAQSRFYPKRHGSSSQQHFSHSRPTPQNQINQNRPSRYNNNKKFNLGYNNHRNSNFLVGPHGLPLPPHPYPYPHFTNNSPPIQYPPYAFPPLIQYPLVPSYYFPPPVQYHGHTMSYHGPYDPYYSGRASLPRPSNLQNPDTDLCNAIRRQIEYYFSDENLVKDYLRNNMDANGWVSAGLVAKFNKIKVKTSNIDLVLKALRPSKVQVEGNSIRKRGDWWRWVVSAKRSTQTKETHEGALIKKIENIHLESSK